MIFRIYHTLFGGHVTMRVFAGRHDGALGKCGELIMRKEEFDAFKGSVSVIEFRENQNYDVRDPIYRGEG